jgi:mRNA interferase RelE/StbE
MSYDLEFLTDALKEWKSLDASVKKLFKMKLSERLENPEIDADKLSGSKSRYKIKLRAAGFRLVYEVIDKDIVVLVVVQRAKLTPLRGKSASKIDPPVSSPIKKLIGGQNRSDNCGNESESKARFFCS